MIQCNTCGRRHHAAERGSADELQFMRVMDPFSNSKLFFCSDGCYLDREFIRAAYEAAKEPCVSTRMNTALRDPVVGAQMDKMRSQYDDIVEEANKSHGLWVYRKRMGITDPFRAARGPDGRIVAASPKGSPEGTPGGSSPGSKETTTASPIRFNTSKTWADDEDDYEFV